MNHTARLLWLAALIPMMLFAQTTSAQISDSIPTRAQIHFAPSLRSAQLDGVSMWLSYAYGGSADIDILEIHPNNRAPLEASLGFRLGVERSASSTIAGPGNDSPFIDYNALLRFSVSSPVIRFDLYTGYVHRTSDHRSRYAPKDLLKSGGELRWMIAPRLFGLLLKAHQARGDAAGGIGVYFGWEK